MAVNITIHDLKNPTFPDQVGQVLETFTFPPELLVLEITETVLLEDPTLILEQIKRFHDMGVQ